MSKLTRALGVVLLVVCGGIPVASAQSLQDQITHVNAQSAVVVNVDTEEVVWAQNPELVRPIASLTKLMTAAVVMDSGIELARPVTIQSADVRKASTTYLRMNDRVDVETLLYLMMVGSDNAAARALARTVTSPTAFVERMNDLAETLGLSQTHYADPSGLDARNHATARDLAKLLVYTNERSESFLMRLLNTPIFHRRIGARSVVISNTNRFLDERTLASKTGYTDAAKYCLTMLIEGVNQVRYAIVVLGAPTSLERFGIGEMFQRWLSESDPLAEMTDSCGPVPESVSDAGKAFIRGHEKLTLRSYYDKNGYAIGYGMHTWKGKKVTRTYPGRVSEAEVEEEFARQLDAFVRFVKTHVCAPMTQPMLDSLVSVAWNLGRVNTAILQKIDQNRPIVVKDFLTTATVRRRVHPMLVNRRMREYLMFSGNYDAAMDDVTPRKLRELTQNTQVVIGL